MTDILKFPFDQLSDSWNHHTALKDWSARLTSKPLASRGHRLLSLALMGPEGTIPFKWIGIEGIPLPWGMDGMMANGYQCWSHSPVLDGTQHIPPENNPKQFPFGDHGRLFFESGAGNLHAWLFTYLTGKAFSEGNPLIAAVDIDLGQTLFCIDLNNKKASIYVDLEGFDFPGGDMVVGQWIVPLVDGPYSALHETVEVWRQAVLDSERIPRMAVNTVRFPRRLGYTSWYYKYTAIDTPWLERNLEAFAQHPSWQIFQIDDGYQSAIGDWLTYDEGFPEGVRPLLQRARELGKTPGIWLAPFIAVHHSQLLRQHPELCLRNQGEPILCGDFPHWGGKFYALDTEHELLWQYLDQVLSKHARDGLGFVKADFLYAAAMVPGGGMTRATRAARAHQRLLDTCQRHGLELLSCGAELGSALLRCNYSRIGPDVSGAWEEVDSKNFDSREQVSTRCSVVNGITRSLLDQVFFGNDPDVFILRENVTMTRAERQKVVDTNLTFGSLIFTSDHLAEYGAWETKRFQEIRPSVHRSVVRIERPRDGAYIVHFASGEPFHLALGDSTKGRFT